MEPTMALAYWSSNHDRAPLADWPALRTMPLGVSLTAPYAAIMVPLAPNWDTMLPPMYADMPFSAPLDEIRTPV